MELNLSLGQSRRIERPCPMRDRGNPRSNPIAAILERSQLLSPDELQALRALPFKKATFEAGQIIQDVADQTSRLLLVLDGIAAVQTDFPDGSRQITDTLVPGDLHGLGGVLNLPPDHAVASITQLSVAIVDPAGLASLLAARPHIYAALFWASQRRERILREHVQIVGGRTARKRVAHLLCCLQARRQNGDPEAEAFRLNVTHSVLADAIGTTTVHVGRVLRELSRERLLRIGRCGVTVVNPRRLRSVAEFQDL